MSSDNLLLSGVPGVGKTTALKKVTASLAGRKIRGFLTAEIQEHGRRVGFEIRDFDGQVATLAHIDIGSPHRVGRYGLDIGALEDISASALDGDADVYIVDEIGKMECFSRKFCDAMTALLDSAHPVISHRRSSWWRLHRRGKAPL